MISVRISEHFLEGFKTFQGVAEDSGVVSRGCTRDSGVVAEGFPRRFPEFRSTSGDFLEVSRVCFDSLMEVLGEFQQDSRFSAVSQGFLE